MVQCPALNLGIQKAAMEEDRQILVSWLFWIWSHFLETIIKKDD